MSGDLLTVEEVAKILRVGPEAVRVAIREGRLIPTYSLSSHCRRFSREDLERQLRGTAGTGTLSPAVA